MVSKAFYFRFFRSIWNGVKRVGKTVWKGVKKVGKTVWKGIKWVGKKVVKPAVNYVINCGKTAFKAAKGALGLIKGDGSADHQTLQELRDLRKQVLKTLASKYKFDHFRKLFCENFASG